MPYIERLRAGGLRGLSSEQTLEFAIPNGEAGSGITMLLGSNNSGKSTFVEALRLLGHRQKTSLSSDRRNQAYGDRVAMTLELADGTSRSLTSLRAGGSETHWEPDESAAPPSIFVVPSRRTFGAYFGKQHGQQELDDRENYQHLWTPTALKSATLDSFPTRLFRVNRDNNDRVKFNDLLQEVTGPLPDWTIDETGKGGEYFLKFAWGDASQQGGTRHAHSSDGLGEGIVSLFFIIDSLYDAEPGQMVVIDEPELSLHPQLQRRLQGVISRLSADLQIVYATHSPYFISWRDIARGARILRVFKDAHGTHVAAAKRRTLDKIARLATADAGNVHVLGLDAAEVFFLEDGVILVEGQDDKVLMPRVLKQLGVDLHASYFGWGVGGATNMASFAQLLEELGYRRVLGLLDNNHQSTARQLRRDYPAFRFECIPAEDIRSKSPREAVPGTSGLLDKELVLRPELVEEAREIFLRAQSYLQPNGYQRIV